MRSSRPALGFFLIPGLCIGLLLAGVSQGSSVALPHTFQPNTVALASEVNENFAALQAAVNDGDTRIAALEARATAAEARATELEDGSFGGVARAAFAVDASSTSPSIVRMFNHVPGGTPVLSRTAQGQYEIEFGSDVSSRYCVGSVGLELQFLGGAGGLLEVVPHPQKPNVLMIRVHSYFIVNSTMRDGLADQDFTLIVY